MIKKQLSFALIKEIPFINALLVPKILLFNKKVKIQTSKQYFDKIRDLGRYSKKVIKIVKDLDEKDLKNFISY